VLCRFLVWRSPRLRFILGCCIIFFFAILPSEVQTFGLSALGLTLDISASQHVCLVMLKTKHYLRSVILAIPDTH
jgi:hypothetical protein